MYTNEELIHYLWPPQANEAVIAQLYACFSRKDYRGMAACYHPKATFSDGMLEIRGGQVAALWHLLCESANDLTVQCYQWNAEGCRGSADWQATYSFAPKGRKVHHLFYARFAFSEGKIIHHQEPAHFWRWAGMALGTKSLLPGWTPLMQHAIRKTMVKQLGKFLEQHPQYQ